MLKKLIPILTIFAFTLHAEDVWNGEEYSKNSKSQMEYANQLMEAKAIKNYFVKSFFRPTGGGGE